MSRVIEFSLPASAFAFEEAFRSDQSLAVELGRVVPTGADQLPYLRARSNDLDAFERRARADSATEQMQPVDRSDEGGLYAMQWQGAVEEVATIIAEANGGLLGGWSSGGQWLFRIRFSSDRDVTQFQRRCVDQSVPYELSRLYESQGPLPWHRFGLTEKQHEALRTAHASGYFEDPRQSDLAALGESLDISPRAVSSRLRRGIGHLVEQTVVTPTDGQ